MKIPYIQISFLLIAVALAFTEYWQWTSAILITIYAYRKDQEQKEHKENPLDKFI